MTGTCRLRLRITGRVQGVGFRWFVRERARRLGLAGWVRNEPDGAVLVEVEGDAAGVGRLAEMVAEGPDGALVDGVARLSPDTVDPLPDPFTVMR